MVSWNQNVELRDGEVERWINTPLANLGGALLNDCHNQPSRRDSVEPRGDHIYYEEGIRISSIFAHGFKDDEGGGKAVENDGAGPDALPESLAFSSGRLAHIPSITKE